MANTRKAGRSNPTQNLDNASTDMNQSIDQDIQSNDMNQRGGGDGPGVGTPGVRSNQSQGGGQQQQQDQQDQTSNDRVRSNDASLDNDSSV